MAFESMPARLGKVDLFAGLSGAARESIAAAGSTMTHAPGRAVVEQGASDIGFRLILEGDAVVEVNGVERARLGPGDYFGEISLIDRSPRSATVRAGDAGMKTFAISALSFEPLLDRHPDMSRVLLNALCARLRAIEATLPGPSTS